MASNLFKRYVWLIDLISRHGHISRQDISDYWSNCSINEDGEKCLPERTFFNHIKSIREIFGIDIKCDRSSGYYISDDEDSFGTEIKRWLLQTLSVNNVISNNRQLHNRIILEESPSSQYFLLPILEAMSDGVCLELTYKSFYREDPSTFCVAPYCLKVFKQRWYLIAKSDFSEKPWVYSLDRIIRVTPSEEKFAFPDNFNCKEYFNNLYGVCFDEDLSPEVISTKVDKSQVPYFKSLPIHITQVETQSEADFSVFTYHLVPTYDFTQEILSKMDTVEVLEPQWYRQEILTIIQSMISKYSTNEPLLVKD